MKNNIKILRKEKNISVTELAARLNMSQGNLTKIENNQLELKKELARKIASILNIAETALYEQTTSSPFNALLILNPEALNLPEKSTFPYLLDTPLPKTAAFYIAQDDAMSKTIEKNSLNIIDTTQTTLKNDGLYLIKYKNFLKIRRLQLINEQKIHIISDNKNYPLIEEALSDISIQGVVLYTFNYTRL